MNKLHVDEKSTSQKIITFGLEFFAVNHCNLKCFGCAQSSPYVDEGFADLGSFKESLSILSDCLAPECLTVLGGEALLHPNIDDIFAVAHNSSIFKSIHLTTNGLLLMQMTDRFWNLIDKIEVSLYPSTSAQICDLLPLIYKKSTEFNVNLQVKDMVLFNEIIVPLANTDTAGIQQIYDSCKYRRYCNTLSNGRFYKCSPSVNLDKFLRYHHINHTASSLEDSLEIDGRSTFMQELSAFLNSPNPLHCCRYCLGSSGRKFFHRQLSKAEYQRERLHMETGQGAP